MTQPNNAFKVKPATISHVLLKEQGVKVDMIIGSKLLKIKVKDFIYQEEPITNKNMVDAKVLCLCECSNFCIFPVKELIDPDVMPACSECNEKTDRLIEEYANDGRFISRLQAWAIQGVHRNERQYSRVFLDFSDRSNSLTYIDRENNAHVTDADLNFYKINNRLQCSAMRGLNTKKSTPQNPIFNYHCLCFKFALFGLDVLATREPMGMCSTCAYELRYSLKNPEINAKTQKLEFKRIWQQYLEDQGYPKLSFKPIWKEYLEERRNLRKHYIELHFKDFLANADFTQKEYLL